MLFTKRFFTIALRLLGVACVAVFLKGCSTGAEEQAFDLPAGRADLTLMQFAKQAGVEIVYDADAVVGARTNAVSGIYAPNDALAIMLSGTGLTIDRDERTGAFAVGKDKQLKRAVDEPESQGLRQGESSKRSLYCRVCDEHLLWMRGYAYPKFGFATRKATNCCYAREPFPSWLS